MMKVKFSNTDATFSRIVAGAMKWGVWGADYSPNEVQEIIEHCLTLGVTTFDHADIYGHYTTEELFGKALALNPSLRSKMQIVTKCGIKLVTPNRPSYKIQSYELSEKYILDSAERSLKNFGTDYIDLLLIHRPSPLMSPYVMAEAFQKLKSAGKVLHFGVSNFTPSQYAMFQKEFPLCTNQVEAGLMHWQPMEDGTIDQLQSVGNNPMAYSPLGAGAVFSSKPTERVEAIKSTAQGLQEKYNASLDQILIAWLLKHPAGILPVLGTSKKKRITAASQALEINLTTEEWFELLEAAKGHPVA